MLKSYTIETNDRKIRRKFRNLPLALVQCECHTGKKNCQCKN